jgi:hypothetical protein
MPDPEQPIQRNLKSDDVKPETISLPNRKGRGRPRKYLNVENVIERQNQKERKQKVAFKNTEYKTSETQVENDGFDQSTIQERKRQSVTPQRQHRFKKHRSDQGQTDKKVKTEHGRRVKGGSQDHQSPKASLRKSSRVSGEDLTDY